MKGVNMPAIPAFMEQNGALVQKPSTEANYYDTKEIDITLSKQLGFLTNQTMVLVEGEVKMLLHLSRHRMRALHRMNPRLVIFDPDCPLFHQAIGVIRGLRLTRLCAIPSHRIPKLQLKNGQAAKIEQNATIWFMKLMKEVLDEEQFSNGDGGMECSVCYNRRYRDAGLDEPNQSVLNTFSTAMSWNRCPRSMLNLHPATMISTVHALLTPAPSGNTNGQQGSNNTTTI